MNATEHNEGITVSALATLVRSGDWHDKPLRYEVTGPLAEKMMFSTKRDAVTYASIRRRSASMVEAAREYARRP